MGREGGEEKRLPGLTRAERIWERSREPRACGGLVSSRARTAAWSVTARTETSAGRGGRRVSGGEGESLRVDAVTASHGTMGRAGPGGPTRDGKKGPVQQLAKP